MARIRQMSALAPGPFLPGRPDNDEDWERQNDFAVPPWWGWGVWGRGAWCGGGQWVTLPDGRVVWQVIGPDGAPVVVRPATTQPYATRNDLRTVGLGDRALGMLDVPATRDAILKASAFADSFLARRYTLPLRQWAPDLTMAVAHIAAYRAMLGLGFNPDAPHDQLLVKAHDDSVQWLKWVGDGLALLAPPVEDSAGPCAPSVQTQRVVW